MSAFRAGSPSSRNPPTTNAAISQGKDFARATAIGNTANAMNVVITKGFCLARPRFVLTDRGATARSECRAAKPTAAAAAGTAIGDPCVSRGLCRRGRAQYRLDLTRFRELRWGTELLSGKAPLSGRAIQPADLQRPVTSHTVSVYFRAMRRALSTDGGCGRRDDGSTGMTGGFETTRAAFIEAAFWHGPLDTARAILAVHPERARRVVSARRHFSWSRRR